MLGASLRKKLHQLHFELGGILLLGPRSVDRLSKDFFKVEVWIATLTSVEVCLHLILRPPGNSPSKKS